jgi:type II secretory ATPase GspE/PulE/Tfp pilus assembly ATPase PilB-like protein
MPIDARTEQETATQRRAQILNIAYLDTSASANKALYKDILTLQELYQQRVIPIEADKSHILFGITNLTSQQVMNALKARFTDQIVNFVLISDHGYDEYIHLYDPPKAVVYQDISISSAGNEDLIKRVSTMLAQVKADDMLGYLVQQAHKLNASDIHIETQQGGVRIRLRIDGVLHPIAHLEHEKYRILLAAIAASGNISTGVNEPQQGHIAEKVTLADGSSVDINVRLETVSTITGTDVVMRIFNYDQSMYTIANLGLSPKEMKIVDEIIEKPSGLVMVVGPTGSGKTTTLYSMLNALNNDERKLITIEDPVEYQFKGITQISVQNSGTANQVAFANNLRAVLRLDPDIIMVGEIRDNDTAKTALQASLTGHLVLTTFHASNAAAALTRLMDVIGQNPLFVSAIRLVMAQRLVRRLDDATKQAYQPSEAQLAVIHGVLVGLPTNIERPDISNLQLFKPGSSETNPYGYSGQIAIREQFTMNGEIRTLLETATTILSTTDIEAAAVRSGMTTMLQDAMLKIIAGETTLEEVYRVID